MNDKEDKERLERIAYRDKEYETVWSRVKEVKVE